MTLSFYKAARRISLGLDPEGPCKQNQFAAERRRSQYRFNSLPHQLPQLDKAIFNSRSNTISSASYNAYVAAEGTFFFSFVS